MLVDIIRQLNWVDILAVIILIRAGYIAREKGLPIELFKLSGTILAIYLAMHYYTVLSDFVRNRINLKNIPLESIDFLFFLALAIIGYLFFVLLKEAFSRLIKMEAVPQFNKWGGFILGIARGILLVSLIVFALAISTISYLKNSVKASYSGSSLFQIAPGVYTGLWEGLMSKLMPKEKFNKTILEVQEALAKK